MTFPIKKRINTDQFIDSFIYKREVKKRIKKISDLLEEGKTVTARKVNAGMKTWHPIWNRLHYMEGKTN